MATTKAVLAVLLLCLAAQPAQAGSGHDAHDRFKKHVRGIVADVKATDDPAEKRAIMHESFGKMVRAIERVEGRAGLSESDRSGLASIKDNLQEKRDELNGQNGFAPVPDGELNNFADYAQQSLEQADRTITISVTTLLLVLIVLILLL